MQARLTIPVLLVTLAVTPPFLLQTANLDGKLASPRQPQPPPWQVLSGRLYCRRVCEHLMQLDDCHRYATVKRCHMTISLQTAVQQYSADTW